MIDGCGTFFCMLGVVIGIIVSFVFLPLGLIIAVVNFMCLLSFLSHAKK